MSWEPGKDAWGPFPAIPAPRPPSPCEMDAAFAPIGEFHWDLFPDDPRVDDYAQTLHRYWAAQRAWSRYRRARQVIRDSSVVAVGSLVAMAWTGWPLLALPALGFALLAIWTWHGTDVSRTTGAMLELDLEDAERAMVAGLNRRLGR